MSTFARRFRRALRKPLGGTGSQLLRVAHDGWCSYVVSGECTCAPDYSIEPLTSETLSASVGRMRQWQRERLS